MGQRIRPAAELPSLKVRLEEGLPLLLLGSALLLGAWAASADRLRIFSSPYPVWILLAMNGTVILGAALVGAFLREPSVLPEDDPELVHVPRARWESLLQRVETVDRTTLEQASAAHLREETLAISERPDQSHPAADSRPPVVIAPTRSVDPPLSSDRNASELRSEMALFELRGIAEAAITTSEKLEGKDLHALLEDYAVDLAHLSEVLKAPRRRNETPRALLVRLLRRSLKTGHLSSEWRAETRRLVDRIQLMDLGAIKGLRSTIPAKQLDVAADELDALVSELEPRSALRRRPANASFREPDTGSEGEPPG
jgi:hypothetical protein